jgi:cytidylate kinase
VKVKTKVPRSLLEKEAQRYIREVEARRKKKGPAAPRRVITISRMFGAGGISVSNRLREILGWPVWDREILDVLASQTQGKLQAHMFEALDEKTQGLIESFVSSVAGDAEKGAYSYLLPRAIYIIAQNDAIILGRGAHIFLPESIKVLLKASLSTRIRNVMQLLGISEREAKREIINREQDREAFLEQIGRKFRRPPHSASGQLAYDIELNMDSLSFEEAADAVVAAAKRRYGL